MDALRRLVASRFGHGNLRRSGQRGPPALPPVARASRRVAVDSPPCRPPEALDAGFGACDGHALLVRARLDHEPPSIGYGTSDYILILPSMLTDLLSLRHRITLPSLKQHIVRPLRLNRRLRLIRCSRPPTLLPLITSPRLHLPASPRLTLSLTNTQAPFDMRQPILEPRRPICSTPPTQSTLISRRHPRRGRLICMRDRLLRS